MLFKSNLLIIGYIHTVAGNTNLKSLPTATFVGVSHTFQKMMVRIIIQNETLRFFCMVCDGCGLENS